LRMGSRSRVYIGRLSNRTRERDIYDAFSRYGRITGCDLKYGFCFVEYEDARDAEDAVHGMDGRELDGSRIIVEFSRGGGQRSSGRAYGPPQRSDYRVTVENLPRDMSWQDLKDHFRRYCEVIFADVWQDRGGRVKGVLEFRSRDDVRRAIREVDNTEVRGNRLTVHEDDGGSHKRRSKSRSRSRSRSRSPRKRSHSSRSRSRSKSRSRSASPTRSKSNSPSRKGDKSPKHSPQRSPSKDGNGSARDRPDGDHTPSPKRRKLDDSTPESADVAAK